MTSPAGSTQREGVRFYTIPGLDGEFPSVTSIAGVMDKPALPHWAAREAAEFAVKHAESWSALDEKAAVQLIKGAAWRGEASSIGNEAHAAVEAMIRGNAEPEFPARVAGHVKGYLEFVDLWKPEWVASELRVVNTTVGYAGSLDVLAMIDTGDGLGKVLTIIDTKTGKGVYPEVGLQISAYANAELAILDDGRHVAMPKIERALVLHLRPRSWHLIPVDIGPATWRGFRALAAAAAWKWTVAPSVLGAPVEPVQDRIDGAEDELIAALKSGL